MYSLREHLQRPSWYIYVFTVNGIFLHTHTHTYSVRLPLYKRAAHEELPIVAGRLTPEREKRDYTVGARLQGAQSRSVGCEEEPVLHTHTHTRVLKPRLYCRDERGVRARSSITPTISMRENTTQPHFSTFHTSQRRRFFLKKDVVTDNES